MYVYLSDVAEAWSAPRSSQEALQELVKAFWLNEFENLNTNDKVGTVLGGDRFRTGSHPDRSWVGSPYNRRQFFDDILAGVASPPPWGIWGEAESDPGAIKLLTRHLDGAMPNFMYEGAFLNLSSCPVDSYDATARDYLYNLALPPDVARAWFHRRAKLVPSTISHLLKYGRLRLDTQPEAEQPRYSKAELEKWYIQRIKDLGPCSSSRERDWADAKAAGFIVSHNTIRELRRRLAPASMKARGRPKKLAAIKSDSGVQFRRPI